MITFATGLFIGAFLGFILAAILAMSKGFDEYAGPRHYRSALGSGVDLCEGRLELGGVEEVLGYSSVSAAQFSHGICPDCKEKLYGDIFQGRTFEGRNKLFLEK